MQTLRHNLSYAVSQRLSTADMPAERIALGERQQLAAARIHFIDVVGLPRFG